MKLPASRGTQTLVLVAALVVTAVTIAVLASPRHRTTVPDATVQAREFVRRVAGRSTAAVIATRREVVAANAEGLRVPISDDPPQRLPVDGVPAGWELREFTGRAEVALVRGERGPAVRLRSARTSFALHRDLVVALDEFPILAWSWKVTRLPTGGDVRERGRDDQAAQIYVVFPRWPAPRTHSEVIGYVWDTTAPVGTTLTSTKAPNVRIIVVESGPAHLGNWQHVRRNVAQDYEALFRRPAPRVGAIALMTDANDTGSATEAAIGDLMFVPPSATERGKTPTPMLR